MSGKIKKYLMYIGLFLLALLSAFLFGSWSGKINQKKEKLKQDIEKVDKDIKGQEKVVEKNKQEYETVKQKIKESNYDYSDDEIKNLLGKANEQGKVNKKIKEELEKIKAGGLDEGKENPDDSVDTNYLNSILNK